MLNEVLHRTVLLWPLTPPQHAYPYAQPDAQADVPPAAFVMGVVSRIGAVAYIFVRPDDWRYVSRLLLGWLGQSSFVRCELPLWVADSTS